MKLLIKNACVVNYDEEPCIRDIYIENGVICEISENLDKELVVSIDAQGNYAIPGLFDMFCQIGEPGNEHREDIISASKSAARGGFTSISCLPLTNPVIDNKTVVDYLNLKSKAVSLVNIYPYGSMTKGCKGEELSEIGQMVRAGVVAVSDGGKSIEDAYLMRKILVYCSMFNIPVITMCDVKSMTEQGAMNRGKISTQIGITGIPREAEEITASRNIILTKYSKSKLHITHVSTRGTTDIINNAKKEGVKVTADTSPHYFCLSEEIVESYNTLAKVRPPLRTKDDIERIKQGLVDGTIDVICSGHTPETITSKMCEFDKAAYGISALETAFCASYTELVKNNILTLPQLVEKMSKKPADILNIENKGEIRVGFDADIVIFSDKKPFTIRAKEFASKAKFSPFDGMKMFGEVLYTIVNGKVVYLK